MIVSLMYFQRENLTISNCILRIVATFLFEKRNLNFFAKKFVNTGKEFSSYYK